MPFLAPFLGATLATGASPRATIEQLPGLVQDAAERLVIGLLVTRQQRLQRLRALPGPGGRDVLDRVMLPLRRPFPPARVPLCDDVVESVSRL